jgi:hypothetical protein
VRVIDDASGIGGFILREDSLQRPEAGASGVMAPENSEGVAVHGNALATRDATGRQCFESLYSRAGAKPENERPTQNYQRRECKKLADFNVATLQYKNEEQACERGPSDSSARTA